jgi:hypothetical protein
MSVGVCAHANLIERFRTAIGVLLRLQSITDVRVRDRSTAVVLAIQEPQPAVWHQPLDDAVQSLHVAALALWLSGNVVGDRLVHAHIALLCSTHTCSV